MEMEYKTNPAEACEFKFSDNEWAVTGYATVFNSYDSYNDRIMPGAFERTLKSGKQIRMHFEHMRWITPGKWIKATEDEKGLLIEGELTPGHSVSTDLRASMKHGTIKGLSQGFNIAKDGYEKNEKGGRDIHDIDLVEVSFTGNPAEPQALVQSFKSELESAQSLKELERFLRESGGYSKSMATALVSHAKALCRSDSEQEVADKLRELEAAARLKAVFDRYDIRNLL